MWGSSDNAYLLPDTQPAELLPTNTAIFSSSVRYGKLWHGIAATCAFCFVLFLGISNSGGVETPSTFTTLAFVLPLIGCLVLYLLHRWHSKEYENSVRMGTWHEGIIVFPSGDVVVRFQGILTKGVDRTIEASYLSRADVERGFAINRLWFRNYLKIHYLGLDARPAVLSICETELRDPPTKIAEYINQVKASVVHGGAGF